MYIMDALVLLLMMSCCIRVSAISTGNTLLNSSIFNIDAISPVTMWSASSHVITLIGFNCSFPSTPITVAQLRSNLVESPTPFSALYGWDNMKSMLITSSASVVSASLYRIVRIALQPVPGFVLNAALTVRWAAASPPACGASTTSLSFSSNTNGGFATVLFCTNAATCSQSSVTNEYDIQNQTLTLVVQLQYNNFILGSPSVSVDVTPATMSLSTGWTFVRTNNITLTGTHSSVPAFNIAAGQTASFSVTISASQTYLNLAPSPSTTGFTINAVDGNPVAYCVLSNNLTDKLIRTGQGLVDITLSPNTKDYFNLYSDIASEQATWNGTIAAALLPTGVSVAYQVLSTTTVRVTFSSASDFFMTDAASVVFSPRASALRSMTAGCGVLRLPISPAPVDVAVVLAGRSGSNSINITELDVQLRVTNLTASIPFESKMFRTTTLPPCTTAFRNSPICFEVSSDYSSPAGLIETRFLAALLASNASITASAPTEFTLSIAIPPLPAYNIDHDKIECIVVRIPAGAMKSGVAPNTTSIPSFCIHGVATTAAVVFASSGANVTDAAVLWDAGDLMLVTLTSGVWDTSAVWVEGVPLLNSSFGDLNVAALTFSPINFSAITFSNNSRTAYVPIVPCRGLSVLANETGSFSRFSSLVADAAGLNTTDVTFKIVQANSSQVGFSCANICTMDDTVANVFITETNVRQGFQFTVTSIYDVLVDQATLTRQRWSLFTRNVSALVSYPGVSLSVVRVNNYTARFAFASMPNFDITADDVAVIFLNTSFLRNKGVKSAIRGFLFFRATVPQPVCSLTTFAPSISERAVQNGDVTFLFTSTRPFASGACANLQSGLWVLAYSVTSALPLNVTVGNCTRDFSAQGGVLPLIIRRDSGYDVSSSDTLLISLNRTFFTGGERCSFDPSVEIPVLPANAHFVFSYNTTVSPTNTTPIESILPYTSSPAYAVVLSERLFRQHGMIIHVNFTGELIKTCTFYLQFTQAVQDQRTTQPTNFTALYGKSQSVNMTATSASRCEPNVSTSAIFVGALPPRSYDIAVIENISFYVPLGVGFGSSLPVASENTVTFTPVSEDSSGTLLYNSTLVDSAFRNNTMRSLPLSSLGVETPVPLLQPSWMYVQAVVRAEELARGGFTTTFELLGDRWTNDAPGLLVASLSTLQMVFPGTVNQSLVTQSSAQTSLSSINLLFPSSTARIVFNTSTLRSTLVFTASADASFYLTSDAYFLFNIPSLAINSGLVPVPSWVGINVTSAPPSLVASGPAYQGGTRRLLLGNLFLMVRLLDDNFIASSISGPTVCPKAFDTCSIVVDPTLRYLNITFPPQDLVIFTRTMYSINISSDNVASHRNISNNVTFTLDVESGILSTINLGSETTSEGTVIREDLWRNGGVGFLSFVLKGDSFVDSPSDIIAALMQRSTCFPASDAFSFCSRLPYMLAGTVTELEVSRQSIRVDLQPDRLFDVHRPELVVLAFGGVATTSTFAPIFVSNLSFVVQPTNGVATMSTTFAATAAAPLSSNDVRDGTKVVVWSFSLAGERWNVGSTLPFIATPGGTALRQLVVAAFNSSVNTSRCPSNCFEVLKSSLFASDVTISSDLRTLQISMVANAQYDTPFTETINIRFTDARLFLSGLLPTLSSIAASDWTMVVAPSGAARLEVSRISPSSIVLDSVATTSSTFVIGVSQLALQTSGVNVTVRMLGAPVYYWDGRKFNGTTAVFASTYTTSTSAVATEPFGFLALQSSMVALYFSTISSTSTAVVDVVFALRPTPTYSLVSGFGETVTFTLPSAWTTANAATSSPTTVSPSSLQFVISVTQTSVVVIVRKSSLTATCPTIGTMRDFLLNVTTLLQTSATIISSTTSTLSTEYCNVTMLLPSSEQTNALEIRTQLMATARAELLDCCSIAIAYNPDVVPTEATLLAAMSLTPPPPPPADDTTEQITWVLVSIGVLVALLAAYYCYRNHISGDAFSGTSRVRAEELHDVWTMKLVIDEEDEDILQQRTREQRQQAAELRTQRVHWDSEGNPTLSSLNAGGSGIGASVSARQVATPSAMNEAANETVFAGQPNRGKDIYHHVTNAAVNVELVELPMLAQEDDIPIAPNAIDGMVMDGGDEKGGVVMRGPTKGSQKRLPRFRRPSEATRFELL
jgi:hypothetical protein